MGQIAPRQNTSRIKAFLHRELLFLVWLICFQDFPGALPLGQVVLLMVVHIMALFELSANMNVSSSMDQYGDLFGNAKPLSCGHSS